MNLISKFEIASIVSNFNQFLIMIKKVPISLFKHREKCHVHTAFIVSIIVVESKALLLRLYVMCPSCC